MINTNVKSDFRVSQFAKLTTQAMVLESIHPGSVSYLCQVASLLADHWTITAQVNNVERAKKAIKEFQDWLDSVDEPGDEGEPSEPEYHTL